MKKNVLWRKLQLKCHKGIFETSHTLFCLIFRENYKLIRLYLYFRNLRNPNRDKTILLYGTCTVVLFLFRKIEQYKNLRARFKSRHRQTLSETYGTCRTVPCCTRIYSPIENFTTAISLLLLKNRTGLVQVPYRTYLVFF